MGTGQYYPTLNNRGLALKILRSYLVTTVLCTKTWSKQTPLCTKGNLQFLPVPDLGFLYIFILTLLLIKPHWNYSIWIRKQTQAERSAGKSNDVELYPTYTGSNKLNCFKVIRTTYYRSDHRYEREILVSRDTLVSWERGCKSNKGKECPLRAPLEVYETILKYGPLTLRFFK